MLQTLLSCSLHFPLRYSYLDIYEIVWKLWGFQRLAISRELSQGLLVKFPGKWTLRLACRKLSGSASTPETWGGGGGGGEKGARSLRERSWAMTKSKQGISWWQRHSEAAFHVVLKWAWADQALILHWPIPDYSWLVHFKIWLGTSSVFKQYFIEYLMGSVLIFEDKCELFFWYFCYFCLYQREKSGLKFSHCKTHSCLSPISCVF